ncbi:SDR family NAD(P)-dependent oxidoreductase [Mycolicibacterium sp. P9-22]|uniref:SDR family oxidoreductase n=1 Tax=Mycolicibacterium sp. P9-22 TaxID=2024613 RepID=UPI0011ED7680|nr:SDR family NAD(P)-dependent oxidoreductase [Mycolicibacterium sp. P9-22]KAA0120614.1 SDR family oxidoreductase [Mycolicibacterium sp. P9-22]
MNLTGRVAFITGAAQGIGAATAQRLAAAGARVAVADMNADGAAGVAQSIEDQGGTAISVRCDVSKSADVNAAVSQAVEALGPITVLINCAGVLRDNLLFRMSDDDWDVVLDTHLKGTFMTTRAAQKYMVDEKWGRIVNVSSTAALGNRGQSNYSAAKAGIQGMTKTHAIELGRYNITVNSVAPGFVETDMIRETARRQGVDFDKYKESAIARNPMRRVAQPIDIANAIMLLCSEEAGFINGQIVYVAGGPRT